jgi:hypothetical protein
MWARKCFTDEEKPIQSPIPTEVLFKRRVHSSAAVIQQKKWEARIAEISEQCAKKLGISRRRFLQTSGGMAVAMLAYNEVFGKTYDVDPIEALDPAAYNEKWPKNEFIFDNQTHHVDVESRWFETPAGKQAPISFVTSARKPTQLWNAWRCSMKRTTSKSSSWIVTL